MDIYVVYGDTGEYSDRNTWDVCAFHSEESAKKLAQDLNALVRFSNTFAQRLRDEFEIPYEEQHVAPRYPWVKETVRTEEHRHLRKLTKNGKRGTEVEIHAYNVAEAEYNARYQADQAIVREFRIERDKYDSDYNAAYQAWIAANWKMPEEFAYMDEEIVKGAISIGSRSYNEDAYNYHAVRVMDTP